VVGLSLVRLLVAAVVLLALAPVTGLRLPARRDLPLVIACGAFGMAAYQVLSGAGTGKAHAAASARSSSTGSWDRRPMMSE
jgi:drug/metabolite transporter (DMT)-like permease